MTIYSVAQVVVYMAILLAITAPLGAYLYRVMSGQRTWLSPVLAPVERGFYRAAGVSTEEQGWRGYAASMIVFSLASVLLLYLIQRLQGLLPLNPQGFAGVAPDLAFNTAVSFVSNTNWQSYGGESTMSYFTQMVGLTVPNFTSAAVGLAVAIALTRGLARKNAQQIGNFWVDVTRTILYVLLPICVVFAVALVAFGVPQTFNASAAATTLDGGSQTIALGPVASQEAIKMLGTNGGGFFNANSAHPFENPTPISNFLVMLSIFAIPSALTFTFGRFVGDQRQGWALWAAMAFIFLAGVIVTLMVEQGGNPLFAGVDQTFNTAQSGGNFEGKETRFGIGASALFAVITTAASCGAVNAMHASLLPMAGFVPLLNIQLGEVVFGGVGAGLYGMLVFVILAVFIAGLMVGRTPEYLGKKIEPFEMKMSMLIVVIHGASILVFSGAASVLPAGLAGLLNSGPHGFSEILYAYSSATGNNGSAFAGLTANSPWYNVSLGLAMLIGRFLMIIPVLAIAGSMAAKKRLPTSIGTFPTHGPVFAGLLIGTVLIVGALTYFPALTLGPIVEQLLLNGAQTF